LGARVDGWGEKDGNGMVWVGRFKVDRVDHLAEVGIISEFEIERGNC
jgi:hypothetical protein